MACISVPAAIIGGAAISAGASAIGSSNASDAATKAAQIQADAATQASQRAAAEQAQIRSDLSPFVSAGTGAVKQLTDLIGSGPGGNPLTAPLTKPFAPTMDQLAQTPGYQFQLDQGTKAVQNSYAAKGLGTSGAALKGATNYAQGLASTTYQSQFNNYLAQNQQTYNMLAGLATTGENAAAQTGTLGIQSTAQANQLQTSAAAALAAGQVGSANAVNTALGNISNSASNAGLLLALNNNGLFGTPKAPTTTPTSTPATGVPDNALGVPIA